MTNAETCAVTQLTVIYSFFHHYSSSSSSIWFGFVKNITFSVGEFQNSKISFSIALNLEKNDDHHHHHGRQNITNANK
ncbi:hypothetical protein DERF_014357 [Dermatophagoides farinae]|uniref:Uncharacterized protein n=1 Tax=Dermatophagoides farinae TaxID=6954 RepID=A0A922KSV7_DERFA|nr:hypothetical protein DERF_014357 [Dermatophagoides farinae]